MIPYRFALLLSVALPLAPWLEARAQDGPAGVEPVAEAQTPVPSDRFSLDTDIVIIGRPYGQAEVESESEFDEASIASKGSDSIADLLDRLAPFIDDPDGAPVILVNGREVGFDRSILSYPPEALDRLAVLKPEAAARYGQRAGKRVVNLILKKKFASLDAEAGASRATAGGQFGVSLSARRVAIDGPTRWHARASIERVDALLERDRPTRPRQGANGLTTLLPSRRGIAFNAGVTRPIGDFSASLNMNASTNERRGVRAPVANDGDPGDPVAGLRADSDSQSFGVVVNISGRIGKWQTGLSANYTRNGSQSLLERDDGVRRTDRDRSRRESLTARLNTSTTVIDLPAGPLTTNLAVDVSHSHFVNRQANGGAGTPFVTDERTRAQGNGQASFNIPLSRRAEGTAGPLGDLSAELTVGAQTLGGRGPQRRFGGGVNWSPVAMLQLRAAFDQAETAPSIDELDGPPVTTVRRIFDFATQETVDVISTAGGNPELARGSQQSLSLTARLAPFDDQFLAFNIGYRAQTARGGITSLPELTPAIEAAFPERITRDAQGRLIAIDTRPINIERTSDAEFTSGIALRLPRPGQRRGAVPDEPGAEPWQYSLALTHRWRVRSELLVRSGLPVIDQLGGDGGQSAHFISLQATVGKRGVGANLSGNWSSATRVRGDVGTDGGGGFRVVPPAIFNLSLFVEPEHFRRGGARSSWMDKLKLSLDIQNVLRGYRKLLFDDGSVPAGYSRYETDPLGRTIKLTARKRF
ncbi:hypothetical protein FPZ54_10875 [Sphingomonas suaedae]|uniref:TonB-dependent receptor n=1 Tax=Sphingomonas suaedae TaxID=2599297 RepID=A0A518RG93_9SPHN|nr:hypothetical protein [Sphingomonas suaedae]QDX26477.1 hypothetical protein FPZ54_10875 [Sphingomonas suaedae]